MRRLARSAGALLLLAAPQIARAAAADAVLATAPAEDTRAQTAIVDRPLLFTDNDQMLLEVDCDGYQLSDGIGAYSSRAGVFLPLGELTRLMDLAIDVDAAHGRAQGWAFGENRRFEIDLGRRVASFDGRSAPLTISDAAVYDGDIYVSIDVLQALLPIAFKIDRSALVLNLVPREKLPFEARLERQNRRGQIGGGGGAGEPVLKVRTPYALFTPPAFDLNLNLEGGSQSPRRTVQFDVRAAGDLLYAGFQGFAASDQNGRINSVRLLFDRKDPDRRDVLIHGLSRLSVGDTYTPGLPLGPRSQGGRGLFLTTAPLEQASVFDKIDIRGELERGWEVELYVDEVLRASQAQPTDGRYAFDQVTLSYGLNVIRLVFYGPRGERREEVRRINVGSSALARGQLVASFGAVQEGLNLVDIRSGPAGLRTTPGMGDLRLVGQLAYGLTSTSTVTAGLARYTPVAGEARTVGALGLATSALGLAERIDLAVDDHGGRGVTMALAGRPAGVSLVARHSEYAGGFVDETQSNAVGLARDTTVTLDYVAAVAGHRLPLDLTAALDQFTDGRQQFTTALKASQPFGRYLVSSSISYQATGGLGGERQLLTELDASGLVDGAWQLRGGLTVQALPVAQVQALTLTADHDIGPHTAIRLGVSQSFGPRATVVQAAATWKLPVADLTLSAAYNSQSRDLRVGLQLSVGFGYDAGRRRYLAEGPAVTAGGSVSLQAFNDLNGDGRREPNEPPIPGLVLTGGRRPATTDARGAALVTGLGDSTLARVRVDTTAVDDPYLIPPPTVIELTPRPGRTAQVPFPFQSMGEVEFDLMLTRPGEKPRGVSALAVQLLDGAGAVVAEAHTAWDGSVSLSSLRPGRYTLRLDPSQSKRLHLVLKQPAVVVVPPSGGFAGRIPVAIGLGEAGAD